MKYKTYKNDKENVGRIQLIKELDLSIKEADDAVNEKALLDAALVRKAAEKYIGKYSGEKITKEIMIDIFLEGCKLGLDIAKKIIKE